MSDTPTPTDESSGLYPALGRLASGLYIITIGTDETATGMLASWVQQAGFEPPMVSLAVKQGRPLSDRLESGEPFVVNVIGEGQAKFLKHFGKGFEPGEPAFEGIELDSTAVGVPALAEAPARLECRASTAIDSSDHRIIIAHVVGGHLKSDDSPMVHVRKRGDHY